MGVKPRLLVVGPLPPPYHGVTISTSLVLANPYLRRHFEVQHLDTSDHRGLANIGNWEIENVSNACRALVSLGAHVRGRPGLIYLPISQNAPAFLRDSLLIQIASRARWKVAIHLRGSEFRDFYLNAPGLLRRWIRLTLARVSSAAVMGRSLRGVFDELVPAERIVVVPNGTPEPTFRGGASDGETVLFLSNLRRRKGVVEALDAALQVIPARPTARFIFAGGWESPQLEAALRARAAPSDGRIAFLPVVEDTQKDALLASASVLLFPPIEPEGHPRVVLEAMAHGLPVVTTDRGAIAETVIDGECGYVLPDARPDELANRILRLLGDRQLREQMAREARSRYLSLFTQEHADRRLAEWLCDVSIGT
jgi:glycosyltransferase involved in cell wall biosynthesis